MKIKWNSNLVNTLLGVIIGALLTIGINYLNAYENTRLRENRAQKVLLIEFDRIKSATPGLLNSFNKSFDIIIHAQMTQLPFTSGSFHTLYQDLLSLDFDDYKHVYEFYSMVDAFQNEYEKMLHAQTTQEKTVYGLMIKESLKKIDSKLIDIEAILGD